MKAFLQLLPVFISPVIISFVTMSLVPVSLLIAPPAYAADSEAASAAASAQNDAVLQADTDLRNRNFAAACDEYKQLLISQPTSIPLLLKLSEALEEKGDLDGAIERARQATVIDPQSAEAHVCLGHYLDANRDEQSAALQYERVLELKGAVPIARRLAYLPLIRLLNKIGDRKKLISIARQFVREFPKDAVSHYDLAWALSQVEETKPTEAIREYKKSLELNADLLSARYNLALLLEKDGKKGEAERELTTFVSKAKDDPDLPKAKEHLKRLHDESPYALLK